MRCLFWRKKIPDFSTSGLENIRVRNIYLTAAFVLASIFLVVFLPSFTTEAYGSFEYRFKGPYLGMDFIYYIMGSLLYFHDLPEATAIYQEMTGFRGVPDVSGYPAMNPVIAYIFYPFTLFDNFRESYYYYLGFVTLFSILALRLFMTNMAEWVFLSVLMLISYPYVGTIERGQISLLLIPLIILSVYALREKRMVILLLLLGVMSAIKVFPTFVLVFVVLYLAFTREYRTIMISSAVALVFLIFHLSDYLATASAISSYAGVYSEGGVNNHSVFSFSYFIEKVTGQKIDVALYCFFIASLGVLLYSAVKQKLLTLQVFTAVFLIATTLPVASFYYNLIVFIPLVLIMIERRSLTEIILLGLIISYPFHLTYKGIMSDSLVGILSIKTIPIIFYLIFVMFIEIRKTKQQVTNPETTR